MKHFILPNMYENYQLNLQLLELYKTNPEYFYDNTDIYAVYGNFQFCVWDGGRVFNHMIQASKEHIEHVLNAYQKHGVKVRFIFTNNMLKPEHYHNRFCNMILEVAEKYDIELVVNDDGLKSYIQENYPSYKHFISSTTKCLTNFEKAKEELEKEDFSMVCFDYNLNKNKKIFELPPELIQKSELLCNAICAPGCPHRQEHYRLNSIYNLNYGKPYSTHGCEIRHNTLHPETFNYHNNLSPEEIQTIYEPAGFQYYKLEGRTLSEMENICNYVRYMIKPEYQFYVIEYLSRK